MITLRRMIFVGIGIMAWPLTDILWGSVLKGKRDLEALIEREGIAAFLGKCLFACVLMFGIWLSSREQEKAAENMAKIAKAKAKSEPMGPKAPPEKAHQGTEAEAENVRPKSD